MSPPGENRGHEPKVSILHWNLMSTFRGISLGITLPQTVQVAADEVIE
jgi:hypothetical protein